MDSKKCFLKKNQQAQFRNKSSKRVFYDPKKLGTFEKNANLIICIS